MKLGIKLRTHSEAQKLSLELGVSSHPTKGKKHTEASKTKISQKCAQHWESHPETKKKISKAAKKQWKGMTDEKKDLLVQKQRVGILRAAKFGSRAEREIKLALEDKGYEVESQSVILQNLNLKVDLYLPLLKTCIEINGISHYEPIYGKDKLKQRKASDNEKYGLIINNGMNIIIVKYTDKSFSMNSIVKTVEKIESVLKTIKDNPVQKLYQI